MEINSLVIRKPIPKNTIEVDSTKIGRLEGDIKLRFNEDSVFIEIIKGTEFDGTAIYLDSDYDWILGKTSDNSTVLIPMKK